LVRGTRDKWVLALAAAFQNWSSAQCSVRSKQLFDSLFRRMPAGLLPSREGESLLLQWAGVRNRRMLQHVYASLAGCAALTITTHIVFVTAPQFNERSRLPF
jgi:hypothetical protein